MFWYCLVSISYPANAYGIYYINGIKAHLQFICNIYDKFGFQAYQISWASKPKEKKGHCNQRTY